MVGSFLAMLVISFFVHQAVWNVGRHPGKLHHPTAFLSFFVNQFWLIYESGVDLHYCATDGGGGRLGCCGILKI